MQQLKIEMIHDLVCSWCPIGYRNIKQAVDILADQLSINLHFLPYELNPGMSMEGEDIRVQMQRKTGWDDRQVDDYRSNLVNIGHVAGVKFDFSKRTHYYNSSLGHLLMHWAESIGQQLTLNEALIPAYFEQGENISQLDSLVEIIKAAGLPVSDAIRSINDSKLIQGFERKLERVKSMRVTSIPTFLIDDRQLITGSNSVEFFVEYLQSYVENSGSEQMVLP